MTGGFRRESMIKQIPIWSVNIKGWGLAVLIISLLYSCENDLSTINKITSQKDALKETGKEVQALYSDLGKVKAQLLAPVMNHMDDPKNPYTELPSGLLLYFYDDSLQIQSKLSAGYGISYDNSDEMIARNNVVVISENGDKLESEELIWSQKTEKIRSDKFVKITTDDEIIYGDGFESNDDLTNYVIKKIRGTFKLKDGMAP